MVHERLCFVFLSLQLGDRECSHETVVLACVPLKGGTWRRACTREGVRELKTFASMLTVQRTMRNSAYVVCSTLRACHTCEFRPFAHRVAVFDLLRHKSQGGGCRYIQMCLWRRKVMLSVERACALAGCSAVVPRNEFFALCTQCTHIESEGACSRRLAGRALAPQRQRHTGDGVDARARRCYMPRSIFASPVAKCARKKRP